MDFLILLQMCTQLLAISASVFLLWKYGISFVYEKKASHLLDNPCGLRKIR